MRPVARVIAPLMLASMAAAQAPDAGPLLAAARRALGGDTALGGVTSFTVTGSLTRDMGPIVIDNALEIACVLPDKFLRVLRRSASMGPLGGFQITTYEGFNGDEPIHDIVAPGAPVPMFIPSGPEPTTPAEIAAAKQRRANANKHIFIQLIVPLFATSFGVYPLDFTTGGQAQLATGSGDVIDLKGPDGFTWRLILDSSTHLPIRLTWMDKPIVVFSSSSTVAVNRDGQVRSSGADRVALPSGDPTAGMANVPWELAISEYRLQDGLNWPHRLTTTVNGKKFEEVRLGRFRINPTIDPKRFSPR